MASLSPKIVSHPAVAALCLVLAACGGGSGDTDSADNPPEAGSPPPPAPGTPLDPVEPPTPGLSSSFMDTEVKAVAFLNKATFGASPRDINKLVGTDAADWLSDQFGRGRKKFLPAILADYQDDGEIVGGAEYEAFWDAMITGRDQLRLRMTFALSQILVVSGRGGERHQVRLAHYMDVLGKHAFGNYRNLLEDVTYSQAMSRYLTYYRNQKGDEETGRMPDENYARELMQLFTIGLVELNLDGTPRTDSRGEPIETYDNNDIIGLARVFTGMASKGEKFHRPDADADWQPLQVFDDRHSPLEKRFLNTVIPAGTGGEESIDIALDALFEHPNMAPFLARQLIQRFTMSHPSPAYVERVARAFETGRFDADNGQFFGRGKRGDLMATLAATLLDPVALGQYAGDPNEVGKIREPILRFVHWARAFRVRNVDSAAEPRLGDTRDPATRLGQQAFRSPSVFNFYRPGYLAPGTATGTRGLTAPEFQLVNEASAIGYANFMTEYIFNQSRSRSDIDTFLPKYTTEIDLADDPAALVAHLDIFLTAGRMTEASRREIADIVAAVPLSESDPEGDLLKRAQLAVMLAVNTPAYAIQQ